MDLTGHALGHYRIEEEISRGGMGIVYRATDTRLNREVALKVLPEDLTHDPDRRRRFLQEAQAASAIEPWFQKIVDRSAERTYDPVEYVRSWYYLGKIREERGDTVGAREAYRRFVTYWKDGTLDHDRVAEAERKIQMSQ